MLSQSISRNSILLAVFAVCTTLLISGTYLLTKDRIALAQRQAEEKALLQIVSVDRHNNSMLDDTIRVGPETSGLGLSKEKQIYLARQDDTVVAAIIPTTATDGYSGDIDLIVGVNADGSIAGVRALAHKETPGLGDLIEADKSDWIKQFENKSLQDPPSAAWAIKRDGGEYDQLTGASITPRAVIKAVKQTLVFFEGNPELVFGSEKET